MTSKKIAFVSLGCAKNLCDTEVMLKKIADAGYEIVPEAESADAVVEPAFSHSTVIFCTLETRPAYDALG